MDMAWNRCGRNPARVEVKDAVFVAKRPSPQHGLDRPKFATSIIAWNPGHVHWYATHAPTSLASGQRVRSLRLAG